MIYRTKSGTDDAHLMTADCLHEKRAHGQPLGRNAPADLTSLCVSMPSHAHADARAKGEDFTEKMTEQLVPVCLEALSRPEMIMCNI